MAAEMGRRPYMARQVMLVVAWVYYSALIFYFGAEFPRAYATRFEAALCLSRPIMESLER